MVYGIQYRVYSIEYRVYSIASYRIVSRRPGTAGVPEALNTIYYLLLNLYYTLHICLLYPTYTITITITITITMLTITMYYCYY